MPTPQPRRNRAAVQRGSMAVTMLWLLVGLSALLGLVEVGYLYWAKRDAQKVADLAAIAGVQRMDQCVASDNAAARVNAVDDHGFTGELEIACGHWSPTQPLERRFIESDDATVNAVQVVARRSGLTSFFLGELVIVEARAVALATPPTTAFSVGAQLLRLNGNTPLGSVLKLVGADLDNTSVLGYDGLAQVKVTAGGLLEALGLPLDTSIGVGELEALLAARRVSLAQVLDASARLVAQDTGVSINLHALHNALGAALDLDAPSIQLGGRAGALFASIASADGLAAGALETELSVLDLLNTSIMIAGQGRAVAIRSLDIAGVRIDGGIVEPPSLGMGGVGTRAYNAQIRVYVDIDTDNISVPLVPTLLRLLDTRLRLPLHVDVTNAMGTLTEIHCNAGDDAPDTATIDIESSILRACVGRVDPAARYSTADVCGTTLQDETLLRLLGAPLVRNRIELPALHHQDSLTLAAGETGSTRVNSLALGDAVQRLTRELLRVLSNMLAPQTATAGDVANDLARQYAEAAPRNGGRYSADNIIALARNGSPELGLAPIGDWQVSRGVPRSCGLLFTCWRDGSVWEGYRAAVTGQGLGVLDGLLGTILGGLVINRCDSLIGNILNYNGCVTNNLASYLQTAPEGVLDAAAADMTTQPGTAPLACGGLLCRLLGPVIDLLRPVLNGIGALLSSALADLLGLELGRTDVHLQSLQCTPARLVQ
ncbi:TadG family pilus assembly protein [Luteimonas abyssi]|uniref:TadG family pilus assembly protein n=1 Tax=Luteimonas abyssi TaxID=1247514 RepID=UPI000737D27B|nr:TadG family pilus assembly protein [Luteimonas abyssi]